MIGDCEYPNCICPQACRHEQTKTDMVRAFHKLAGYKTGIEPLDTADLELRAKLIGEEARELIDELSGLILDVAEGRGVTTERMAAIMKETSDVEYTVKGLKVEMGDLNWDEAFKRVHASNMSKLPVTKRADGKLLKGPNYKKPNLTDLVS